MSYSPTTPPLVSTSNSSTTPIAAGGTFTGAWEEIYVYGSISVGCFTDAGVAGQVTAQFSQDGVSVSGFGGPWPFESSGSIGVPRSLIPTASYFRVVVENTSGSPQTVLGLQTLYFPGAKISIPTSRVAQSFGTYTDVLNVRAVLVGADENDNTYENIGISPRGGLLTESVGPLGAFGENTAVAQNPRVGIDAIYGLITTDVETFTATGGSATAANSLFSVTTGTSVGGFGVVRSKRTTHQQSGLGMRLRFSAMFPTAGVANSIQFAGPFSVIDGLFFGYNEATFGITRRIAGATEIQRLTVTAGAAVGDVITVTLNGTVFVLPATAGILTTSQTAEFIAESGVFTGWTSAVSPTSNGSTVTFIQNIPAVAGGAYTLTSTLTAAGTFTRVQAGAANDDTTGFVAQSSWNVDTMDGSGNAANPSGSLLDKAKLNMYEVIYSYDNGTIQFRIMLDNGRINTVHRILYPNMNTIPSQRNPTYRIGWIAASLGSTTALTVSGGMGAGFVEGPSLSTRDPYATGVQVTATTTEVVAIAVRNRGEFGSTNNQRVVDVFTVGASIETSNRLVSVRVYLNPTMAGTVNWSYVSQSISCMEKATPSGITPSGGQLVDQGGAPTGAPLALDISRLNLRLEAGDVLVVTVQAASSTAVTDVSINWQER